MDSFQLPFPDTESHRAVGTQNAIPAWVSFSVSFFLLGSRIHESHTLPSLCVWGTEGRARGRNRGPALQEVLGSWEDETASQDREAQGSGHSLSKCS